MTSDTSPEDANEDASIGGFEAQFTEVDGIRTRYYDVGEGEPLLLLHGGSWSGWTSANTWFQNLGPLSESFRVIAPDRMGAGLTGVPDSVDDWVYGSEVDHMLSFIDQQGLDQFHLVGHSRGAGLAGTIAVARPTQVRTFVALNSQTLAQEAGDYFYRRQRSLLRGAPDPENTSVEDLIRHYIEGYSYNADFLHEDYLAAAAYMETRPKTVRVKEEMEAGQRLPFRRSLRERILDTQERIRRGELSMPTLLYWGRNDWGGDLLTGIGLYEMISQTNPYVRFKLINECGHAPFQEHPDEFNTDVPTFINFWRDLAVEDREVRERWKQGIDLED